MSLGTANRDGGKTSESGHLRGLTKAFRGEVSNGLNVSQRGAGANMSVDIAVGDAFVPRSDGTYAHPAFNDAVLNQAITTADPSNPRRDIVVMYIDYTQTPSTGVSNNTNGVVKVKVVAGTPAGSPVDPTDTAIQTSVGSGNPFIKLARARVGAGVTSIGNSVIDDLRRMATAHIQGGWLYDYLYTWVYVSATSFKVTGIDLTLVFRLGTKIMLNQGGTTKYFVVKSSTFSTDTTVNLISAGDVTGPYSLTNVQIDIPAYSYQATPQGFPGVVRRVIVQMGAEETGGATSFNNYGKEVQFASGANPSGFARAAVRVPKDYVPGTSINLIAFCMHNATQASTLKYYIEGLNVGDDGATTPWNIASNLNTASQSFTAKITKEVTVANIASGSVAVDKFFGLAVKPDVVLSATFEIMSVVLEYTAYS